MSAAAAEAVQAKAVQVDAAVAVAE